MGIFLHWKTAARLLLPLGISLGLGIHFCSFAYAEDVVFSALPERCVVVRKGQTCHLTVNFAWQLKANSDICLLEDGASEPLRCWYNVKQGALSLRFASEHSMRYVLFDSRMEKPVAQITIPVAWVYQNDRRTRASWRLF